MPESLRLGHFFVASDFSHLEVLCFTAILFPGCIILLGTHFRTEYFFNVNYGVCVI